MVVTFPLLDEPETAFVAWTTTPWTLPSNLALCVHPEMDYIKIKEKESGEVSETADLRSKFQKLMRISAREEMAMTENAQLSAYLPLRDYLKKYLFASAMPRISQHRWTG